MQQGLVKTGKETLISSGAYQTNNISIYAWTLYNSNIRQMTTCVISLSWSYNTTERFQVENLGSSPTSLAVYIDILD